MRWRVPARGHPARGSSTTTPKPSSRRHSRCPPVHELVAALSKRKPFRCESLRAHTVASENEFGDHGRTQPCPEPRHYPHRGAAWAATAQHKLRYRVLAGRTGEL